MANSTIAKFFIDLGFNDAEFKEGIKKSETRLKTFEGSIKSTFSKLDSGMKMALTAGTAALAGFGVATAVTGAKFEQSMQTVGAISGATRDEMAALEQKARQLGATTTFTATESATAMQAFARAGMKTNEVLEATGPALFLAGAAGEDMALATNTMAASLAQFGYDADQSGRVADVFTVALQNSLFDLRSLTEAMKYGGAVGNAFGMSIEQTTASLALFRDLGLEGSMAGTRFRMAMAAAAKGTDKAKTALAGYQIHLDDINPETHTFAEILQTVGDAGITATDAIAVFGTRAGADMATLGRSFADGSTKYHDLVVSMENSTGRTQTMYEDMMNTVQGQFTIMKSALQEFMIVVFDLYSEPLKDFLTELALFFQLIGTHLSDTGGKAESEFTNIFSYLTGVLRAFGNEWAEAISNFITNFGTFISQVMYAMGVITRLAKMLAAVWVVGKVVAFTAAIYKLILGMQALIVTTKAAIAAGATLSLTPIGAIITAVALLAAGLYYVTKGFGDASDKAQKFADAAAILDQNFINEAEKKQAVTDGLAASTRDYAAAEMLRLSNAGELTNRRKAELTQLSQLTGEEAKASIEKGKLFSVYRNGVEVLTNHSDLLNRQGGELKSTNHETAVYKKVVKDARLEVMRLETRTNLLQAAQDQINMTGSESAMTYRDVKIAVQKYGLTVEQISPALREYNKQLDTAKKTVTGLSYELGKAEDIQKHLTETNGKGIETVEELTQKQKAYIKKLNSATKARQKFSEAVLNALKKESAAEKDRFKEGMEKKLRDMKKVFDKELALLRKNSAKRKEVLEEQAKTEENIRQTFALKALGEQRDNLRKVTAQLAGQLGTEEQIRDAARKAEGAALKADYDAVIATTQKGDAEQLEALINYLDGRTKLKQKNDDEDAKRLKASQDALQKVIDGYGREGLAKETELATEMSQMLVDSTYATQSQRLWITNYYQGKIDDAKRDTALFVAKLTGASNAEVLQLEKDKADALAKLAWNDVENRTKVAEYYNKEIEKAQDKIPTKFEKVMGESWQYRQGWLGCLCENRNGRNRRSD